jgi:membrane protein YqaA with SNARE-associated domain
MHPVQAWHERLWQRFVALAQGPYALVWLAVFAMLDPIFSPVPPEVYLAALVLAHPKRWREYLTICIAFSTLGAAIGYFVGAFLFHQFGLPLLHFYHFEAAFREGRHLLMGHVIAGMILVAFSLIPEKVVVLAAGFLGAFFPAFIIGFFIGRALRLALIAYLMHRFGTRMLDVVKKYFFWFTLLLVAILLYYGIVHFHLVHW